MKPLPLNGTPCHLTRKEFDGATGKLLLAVAAQRMSFQAQDELADSLNGARIDPELIAKLANTETVLHKNELEDALRRLIATLPATIHL